MHEALDKFLAVKRSFSHVLDFWRYELMGPAYLLEKAGHHEEAGILVGMWLELRPIQTYYIEPSEEPCE